MLEDGFKKADSENIPKISGDMIIKYITYLAGKNIKIPTNSNSDDCKVDLVQVKRDECCVLKGQVLYPDPEEQTKSIMVSILIDENISEILSLQCEDCESTEEAPPCSHALSFLFWTHRKSSDHDGGGKHFWSSEANDIQEDAPTVMKIKDIFAPEEGKMDMDDGELVTEDQGKAFLNAVLDQLEKNDLTDSPLYRHCRPVVEEFEPVYIHHTMLDSGNNNVRDYKTFIFHMEDVAKRGLFEKVQMASVHKYKKRIWMETQYCRIRCSLIHRIANRKDPSEDEEILDAIFCTEREWNIEERQQLKEHKRFILKQTEKLVKKEYKECGILLSQTYPYLCATPDGISDDHIVEIKSPKTNEEFEKFLQGKETVSSKYMAQLQVQMYLANVSKALYCVLSPAFETNGALHYVWVQADMEQVYNLINAAEDYWKDVVFARIKKIYVDK